MKILTVIPIAKGVPREELSYFSAKDVPVGTLVTAPFGNRKIKGVVVDQNEVRDLKGSIKSSNFALRNVTTVHSDEGLPSAVFKAGQETAHFFAQRVGAVLETMIPNHVFDYYASKKIDLPSSNRLHHDIQAVQVNLSERISIYKTLVRENLGKNMSTLLIVPSVIQAEKMFAHLKTGIADRIVMLHGRKSKKHLEEKSRTVLFSKDPLVLVATAPYASIIRSDWDAVIVEEASSAHYRYTFGPVFDMRFFVEAIARLTGTRLIFADTMLDATIRSRIDTREITDLRTSWHITKPERFRIVDMKEPDAGALPVKKKFQTLDPITLGMIAKAVSRKSNVFLLTTRKGLAPLTVCSDCGTTVTCPICDTPLVLHRKSSAPGASAEARVYVCHHCLYTTPPTDRCAKCGSWKLSTFGISTESIADAVRSHVSSAEVYVIDGEATPTPGSITKVIKQWNDNPGSVLVSTSLAIPYVDTAPFGAIVSMDSLLAIPSYTGSEHGLHTTLSFLERISEAALLQTRSMSHEVIQAINKENLLDFVRDEIKARTQFGYPPARVLVKVSLDVPKSEARSATDYLEKVLATWNPDILAKRSKTLGTVVIQALLKIDPVEWNSAMSDIQGTVRDLSSDCRIEVNPDSVL